MERFTTVDGTYDNDAANRRIRLVRAGVTGPWRSYAALTKIRIGSPVLITWEPEDAARPGQRSASRTKPVVSIPAAG